MKTYIIPFLALLSVIVLLLHGPIAQDQNYHKFADDRVFWGVPNFLNVITNLPFVIIGFYGLRAVRSANEKGLRQIMFALFSGFLLLTFGSGYYHLYPNNETLVYDRIPIVIIFMSFFALVIYDCCGRRAGYISFITLNSVGVLSVVYWIVTEHAGRGDLRWYGMVQFFPVVAIPAVLFLQKPPFNYSTELIPMFIFFGVAKFAEHFDTQVYHLLKGIISGHSLKHIFVALAGYEMVLLLGRRVNLAED
jgi:hypothetical protein